MSTDYKAHTLRHFLRLPSPLAAALAALLFTRSRRLISPRQLCDRRLTSRLRAHATGLLHNSSRRLASFLLLSSSPLSSSSHRRVLLWRLLSRHLSRTDFFSRRATPRSLRSWQRTAEANPSRPSTLSSAPPRRARHWQLLLRLDELDPASPPRAPLRRATPGAEQTRVQLAAWFTSFVQTDHGFIQSSSDCLTLVLVSLCLLES